MDAAVYPETGTDGLSQMARVVDTYVAPSKTFRDILRDASWWLPFLLLVVISVADAVVIDKKVGFDTVVQNTMHSSPKQEERLSGLEPAQRAAQLRVMTTGYRYTTYASPVIVLIFSALGALVLWASFNFILGAKATYAQMLAVWMYASLPRLLGGLVMSATLLLGNNAEAFDLKNPVGTNLAFYMPESAEWLRSLLSFFDVIGLWVLALLVIGTAIVARVTTSKAVAVVVGWWLLVLVISVGFAAASS